MLKSQAIGVFRAYIKAYKGVNTFEREAQYNYEDKRKTGQIN